jgi:hypothetical protein
MARAEYGEDSVTELDQHSGKASRQILIEFDLHGIIGTL